MKWRLEFEYNARHRREWILRHEAVKEARDVRSMSEFREIFPDPRSEACYSAVTHIMHGTTERFRVEPYEPVKLAWTSLTPEEDVKHIEEHPCALHIELEGRRRWWCHLMEDSGR